MNMKKNLKVIVCCLTSLALAVSLTACSGSSSSTATEAPAAEEKDSGSGESDGGSASVDIDRGSEFVTLRRVQPAVSIIRSAAHLQPHSEMQVTRPPRRQRVHRLRIST